MNLISLSRRGYLIFLVFLLSRGMSQSPGKMKRKRLWKMFLGYFRFMAANATEITITTTSTRMIIPK